MILLKLTQFPALLRRFGSSALLLSWIVTALRLGNLLLLLPLILRKVPREDVGLWFLLLNLTQLFTLVEIGFQSTIARSVSFLQAGATHLREFGIAPVETSSAAPNIDGLSGLLETSRRLYRFFAAVAGALALLGGGMWLSWTHPAEFAQTKSIATFVVLCLACAFGLAGLHWNAFLFGLNRVREAQAIQIRALVASYAFSITGLLLGGGIFALALGQLVLVLWSRCESWFRVRRAFPEISVRRPTRTQMRWQILWPMAWRTGAHTFFSYLAMTASVLICGQVMGLAITASYGLCFQGAAALHGIANTWLLVKYPLISQQLAAGDWAGTRRIFTVRMAAGIVTFAAGALAVVLAGPEILALLNSKTPLLPTFQLLGLFAVFGLDLVVASHAAVLLLSNRANHLPNLAVAGILHPPIAWFLGLKFGVPGLIAAVAISYAVIHGWRTPWQLWRLFLSASSTR